MRVALAGPVVALCLAAPAVASHVHHDISVRLDPAAHRIEGVDTLTLPGARRSLPLRFRIHAGLEVSAADPAWVVVAVKEEQPGLATDAEETALEVPVRSYEARRADGATTWPADAKLALRLAGVIDHPVTSGAEEYARSFAQTPGTISDEGVVLSGSTWWLPVLGTAGDDDARDLITFSLTADVPEGWDVVSQGKRLRHELTSPGDAKSPARRVVTWDCPHPMDEAYLIAAKFVETERPAGAVTAHAFLRSDDPALASKYLEATAQYIDMYERLLGPYPFEKFALVENFWETGYGMPSFTLLGSQVIRMPFILHSSYPHEILHNWWGNSVYVDWSKGNWCEGLTAYLADHLIREGQGRGAEYRLDTLKGYRDYVTGAKDFPLVDFRSRHSSATQAVGYGKCLMLWHMLRVKLGDERFVQALRRVYMRQKFAVTSWADVERIFSESAGEDLKPFFKQWTERSGAPALALSVKRDGSDLVLGVRQAQDGEPFAGLLVPAALTLADGSARVMQVRLDGRDATMRVQAEGIVRVDLDPEGDVFRRLDRAETPPTNSEIFGADHVTIVVPAEGTPLAKEWAAFAATWAEGGKDVKIVREDQIDVLPSGRATWVLGSGSRFGRMLVDSVAPHGAALTDSEMRFGVESVPRGNHSFSIVTRHPFDATIAAGWIATDVAAAIPGLARKLPHYGKYSYLAFAGDAPDNVVKGSWPATGSPLVAFVGSDSSARPARGALAKREALASLAPVFDPARMRATIAFLADDAQEGRGVGTAGLDRSADHIAKAFSDAGLKPGGADGTFFDAWSENDGPGGKPVGLRNVVGVIPGTNPALADQCVVLGAHYDHLGLGWPDAREGQAGKIHNGADDNASGVAALLEVARILGPELKPARSVVFVAFSGEEWGLKGSRRFVKTRTSPRPFAMVNLDTVGRLGDRKLLVLGAGTASEWRHVAMGIGFTTGVESASVADDPGGSDQVAFHEAGIPAVQLFAGPNEDYHRPTDDIEKVDIAGLVKVATWLREAAAYLGDRPEPLTSALSAPTAAAAGQAPAAPAPARRVSLGTMPDFEFAGPGVKVGAVTAGSPAETAGLAAGDIILAIGGKDIADLRAYSDLLKAHSPGDKVLIRYRRGDETKETEATLDAR